MLSDTCHLIIINWYLLYDTCYLILFIWNWYIVLDTWYWVLVTWYFFPHVCLLIDLNSTCSLILAWDTCDLIPVTWYLLPDTCYLILVTWYLLPDICYLILVTWYLSPDNCYLILSTCYLILISWYLFPNTWCKIGSLTLVNHVLPHYFLFHPIKLCLTTLKPTWTHLVLLNPCLSPFDN